MPDTTYRPMTDADEPAIIALWHAAGITRPWNDPATDIAFARNRPHSTIIVGDQAGQVVASVMVGEDGHRGWVWYVATSPAHRGEGLGRAIMDQAEAWLRARGVWKLQLLVREDNTAVKQFYEHLGYRDVRATCFQKIIADPG